MRHGKKINHLGRTASHRKAMLSNMASSLILNKRISTTVAKAKALRKYVEPLMTRAKDDTTHSRRVVFSYLNNKESVQTLFDEVAEKIASRPGGYTRIIKTGTRLGDNAEMCVMELVDYNELLLKEAKPAKSKRKSRRGGKSKKTQEATATTTAATVEAVDAEAGADALADEVVEVAGEAPVEETAQKPEDQAEAANTETDQVQAVEETPADEAQVVSEEAAVEAPVEETAQKPEDQAEKGGGKLAEAENAAGDTPAIESEDAADAAKSPETPKEDSTEPAASGQSDDEPKGETDQGKDATEDEKEK